MAHPVTRSSFWLAQLLAVNLGNALLGTYPTQRDVNDYEDRHDLVNGVAADPGLNSEPATRERPRRVFSFPAAHADALEQ